MPSASQILEPSRTDVIYGSPKLKYARGHLFRCHNTKSLETYRVYRNVDLTFHELTLFAYSFLNAAIFVLNLVLTSTQTGSRERQLLVKLHLSFSLTLGVKFSLGALISL